MSTSAMEIEVSDVIGQAEHRVEIAPSGAVFALIAGEKAGAHSGWYTSLTLAASLTLAWTVFVISFAVRPVKLALR